MAELRRCIGSTKFGIEAHDAPVDDFPAQASQRDGLGRMCRLHWNEYTNALRKAALARKTATDESTSTHAMEADPTTAKAKAKPGARRRQHGAAETEVAQEPPTS